MAVIFKIQIWPLGGDLCSYEMLIIFYTILTIFALLIFCVLYYFFVTVCSRLNHGSSNVSIRFLVYFYIFGWRSNVFSFVFFLCIYLLSRQNLQSSVIYFVLYYICECLRIFLMSFFFLHLLITICLLSLLVSPLDIFYLFSHFDVFLIFLYQYHIISLFRCIFVWLHIYIFCMFVYKCSYPSFILSTHQVIDLLIYPSI